MVYYCQYPVVIFLYISVGLPVIRSIPRNILLFPLYLWYHISVLRILGGVVPPVVRGLVIIFYFALAEARLVGIE